MSFRLMAWKLAWDGRLSICVCGTAMCSSAVSAVKVAPVVDLSWYVECLRSVTV